MRASANLTVSILEPSSFTGGRGRPGRGRPGRGTRGHGKPGRDRPGRDRPEHGKRERGRRPLRAGRDRPGRGRTGRGKRRPSTRSIRQGASQALRLSFVETGLRLKRRPDPYPGGRSMRCGTGPRTRRGRSRRRGGDASPGSLGRCRTRRRGGSAGRIRSR